MEGTKGRDGGTQPIQTLLQTHLLHGTVVASSKQRLDQYFYIFWRRLCLLKQEAKAELGQDELTCYLMQAGHLLMHARCCHIMLQAGKTPTLVTRWPHQA